MLPEGQKAKKKVGTPDAKPQEVPTLRLERETGFEPATLSLGMCGAAVAGSQLSEIRRAVPLVGCG